MAYNFIGYTTVEKDFGNTVLENIDLAKRDLLNHFYTKRGERLGEPDFGSILPLMVFEQLDDTSVFIVEDDVRIIVESDPRWNLIDLNTTIGQNSIECEIFLNYVPTTTTTELYLNYTTEES